MHEEEELYRELRPLLFAIAYRMVSSASEAEDLVQDAYARYEAASKAGTVIDSPKAYLVTVTTRLAIDHLRSARVRREAYVGPWLPEPLPTEPGPEDLAATADSLATAFLVLLETLSPVERAVFLLREVFGYGYDEIAAIVGKSEPNCRQIFARARRHIDAGRPRFQASPRERDELVDKFLEACERGDLDELMRLLAEDAALYADGGGKVAAVTKPVVGRENVVKLIRRLLAQARQRELRIGRAALNGQAGGLLLDAEGNVVNAVSFGVRGGAIAAIWSVANPDKLAHVRPPAASAEE